MAKRKRLELPPEAVSRYLETKTTPQAPQAPRARMPIADVAGDTAGRAALEEVARAMTQAEEEGRVVKKLPLAQIATHHLSRDRMVLDEDDMEALALSIQDRGQQTPIEVVRLAEGAYGLISGLRRVEALRRIGETHALAFVRQPETSQSAYQAMVEENEIRADLSFYERAQIAVAAAEQGVYASPKAAVKALFGHAPKAKRSKITKFVTICETLGPHLGFPTAIPEHLGLKLVQAMAEDPGLAGQLAAVLAGANPADAAAERKLLEAALKSSAASGSGDRPDRVELARNMRLEVKAGRAVLSGKAVDADFVADLTDWIRTRHPD